MLNNYVMKLKQAINIAVESMDKDIQRIAFDANLFEKFGAPHGQKAWKKRERLRQAKEMLSRMEEESIKSSSINQTSFPFLEESSRR